MINRKETTRIKVGNVPIGHFAPVSVQSMITTNPVETEKAIAEINLLAEAGCDLVRLAVPDMAAAKAIKAVKAGAQIPLIADIHFDYTWRLKLSTAVLTACVSIRGISAASTMWWPLLKKLNQNRFLFVSALMPVRCRLTFWKPMVVILVRMAW